MLLRSLLLAFVLATYALAADETATEPDAPAKSFQCGLRFRRPGFASVDDFVQVVTAREAPWSELLQPDKIPEYDTSNEIVAPGAMEVDVIHRTRRQAIVFAQWKANRTAPFSAVTFLLTKQGSRWHVSDFIRRSTSYESYSELRPPTMLKLRPEEHLHFYFRNYMGGRRLGVDTDEFYMVEGSRFRRTLLLKNDGAYISPADPWREFVQDAQVSAVSGRLRIRVQRTWGLENGEERKQAFTVTFRWDPKRHKFVSPSEGRIFVNEPSAWSSKGLPAPPAGE